MGAYASLCGPGIPILGAFHYHGVYDCEAYSFSCTSVYTNRTPTDAYRGAGRPEATYATERIMDALARRVGKDPAEVRAMNFIPPFDQPRMTAGTLEYDSGNYRAALDKAKQLVGYDELRRSSRPATAAATASCSASGSPATWRSAAGRRRRCWAPSSTPAAAGNGPRFAATNLARSPWSSGPPRTARGTAPPSPRSWPTPWASPPTTSRCWPATPRSPPGGWTPTAAAASRRGHGHPQGGRAGPGEGQGAGRPRARGRRGRPRVDRRQVPGTGRPRPGQDRARAGPLGLGGPQHARGRRPGPGGQRGVRPAQLDVSVRDPHLRGRGRPGDRLDPDQAVRCGGRLRHDHQPAGRGRPGHGRGCPGHRRGAVRGGALRRQRDPADRQHVHLPDPVRGRAARLHPGQDRDPLQHQPHGGQGHRRDRHHRRPAGGDERGRRRAALRRGRVHRQAGLGREGLAGRPGGAGPGATRAHARGRRHRRGQYDPEEEGGVA